MVHGSVFVSVPLGELPRLVLQELSHICSRHTMRHTSFYECPEVLIKDPILKGAVDPIVGEDLDWFDYRHQLSVPQQPSWVEVQPRFKLELVANPFRHGTSRDPCGCSPQQFSRFQKLSMGKDLESCRVTAGNLNVPLLVHGQAGVLLALTSGE